MPNITLVVPSELKRKMDAFPEMNWSEVARQAFRRKLVDLEFLKRLAEKANLSESEALRFGREIKRHAAKHRAMLAVQR